MTLRPELRFVYGQTAWMLGVLLVTTLLDSLAYDLFFMLSLIGLFVLNEVADPFRGNPKVRTRLRWLAAIGLLVFGYLLLDRLLDVLLQELP